MPTTTVDTAKQALADLLTDARTRTLALIEPVSQEDLRAQHDPLMGPILWDLGHIAHFEELWLLRHLEAPGTAPLSRPSPAPWSLPEPQPGFAPEPGLLMGEMPGLFNPFENPRAQRGRLALPRLEGALALLADIRARVLERLAAVELDGSPLLRQGYVYRMVAQHEQQHGETILQTLQLKLGAPYAVPRAYEPPSAAARPGGMVRFPGGEVEIGTDDRAAAYDNERPGHRVRLAPFWIDAAPVTNAEYLAFLEAGGYADPRWWTEAGWAWKRQAELSAPMYWSRTTTGWTERSFDRVLPLDPDRPVVHVCCHEAEAFAAWAGKRLPTEQEWEAAATWDPERGEKRAYPWGNESPTGELANIDQLAFGTAPVGAYARNVSPIGCYGMIGDVWEWTASEFRGYPGFAAFPYREYSEVFFGDEYRVLRGGSWATRPGAIRGTFRNWDYPIRRQLFCGFRCARDA